MLIAVHEPNGVRMWGTASGVHQLFLEGYA
jgi:hypothetical protein